MANQNSAPTTALAITPPARPAQVFFGDTRGHSFGPPEQPPADERRQCRVTTTIAITKTAASSPSAGVGPQPDQRDGRKARRRRRRAPRTCCCGRGSALSPGSRRSAASAGRAPRSRARPADAAASRRADMHGEDRPLLAAMHEPAPFPAQRPRPIPHHQHRKGDHARQRQQERPRRPSRIRKTGARENRHRAGRPRRSLRRAVSPCSSMRRLFLCRLSPYLIERSTRPPNRRLRRRYSSMACSRSSRPKSGQHASRNTNSV